MRTTMVIEDELLHAAKKRAAEAGISLSEVVNRARREALSARAPATGMPPFRMATFGRGQPRVDHTPGDLARFTEQDDEPGAPGT